MSGKDSFMKSSSADTVYADIEDWYHNSLMPDQCKEFEGLEF